MNDIEFKDKVIMQLAEDIRGGLKAGGYKYVSVQGIIDSAEIRVKCQPVVLKDFPELPEIPKKAPRPKGGCTTCKHRLACDIHVDFEKCGTDDWSGYEKE
jgi:hypothetical protein